MSDSHREGTGWRRSAEAPRAQWDERLRGDADEASVGCAGFGRSYNRWLYRLRARIFRRVVEDLRLEPGGRVLDVGSGTGFYLEQWRRLGFERVEGLDFSAEAIRHLRSRFPGIPLHHVDIGHVDIGAPDVALESASFDVISAFDVLFHIVDDARYRTAVHHLARLLKPGGVLLLSENFAHHEHPPGTGYHFSRTLEAIRGHLEAAGLELGRRRPMFVLMNAPDDSTSPLLRAWWRLVSGVARRSEAAGWLVGAGLYPVDWVLTRLMGEGPTTELAVCRRREAERR